MLTEIEISSLQQRISRLRKIYSEAKKSFYIQ